MSGGGGRRWERKPFYIIRNVWLFFLFSREAVAGVYLIFERLKFEIVKREALLSIGRATELPINRPKFMVHKYVLFSFCGRGCFILITVDGSLLLLLLLSCCVY